MSKNTTELLKQLKSRTGLTPNILARFAFAASLESGDVIKEVPQDSAGSEMNIGTLFGDLRLHFETLLKQRYVDEDADSYGQLIAGHIEQGTMILRRVKSVADIFDLIPNSAGSAPQGNRIKPRDFSMT